MQEYPVKRGYTKDLQETIGRKLKEYFNKEPERDAGHFRISFGALKMLEVSCGKEGKTLIVSTISDTNSTDEVILDTNRRFRRYLDDVTGYSTKERVKKAKSVDPE